MLLAPAAIKKEVNPRLARAFSSVPPPCSSTGTVPQTSPCSPMCFLLSAALVICWAEGGVV